ncbi:heptaprenyl diphosphate synthase component 1 [Cytobacillus sp. FJAT-53684]|uniref:Heptaprenyl diphosphate synthase component 1 n=1 Tax=Cytobacillus mangrovibacter TaxID=3299024 RepID=A0ABW6JUU6_9BACI
MQNLMTVLADVKEQIEKKMKHPYLLKYIESPIIDEDKLLLLITFLKQGNLPENKAINYCITTMLIQIALDTHELVSNQKLDSEDLKPRQLTVLAGVYYSGLYYKILAGIDDIEMIRMLAIGIKEVNEHKISLYQKSSENIDALMNDVKMIESSLFVKMTSYLDNKDWSDLVSNLLFVKRLTAERELFLHGKGSVVFDALNNLSFPRTEQISNQLKSEQEKKLLAICDKYVDRSKQLIEKSLSNFPFMNELLDKRIQSILSQQKSLTNTFVEEG